MLDFPSRQSDILERFLLERKIYGKTKKANWGEIREKYGSVGHGGGSRLWLKKTTKGKVILVNQATKVVGRMTKSLVGDPRVKGGRE